MTAQNKKYKLGYKDLVQDVKLRIVYNLTEELLQLFFISYGY